MNSQLALSIFDELPEGFIPKERLRMRRAARTSNGNVVEIRQLSLLDLLTMSDEEIGPVSWSEDDIETLREGILREACHVLLDNRASMATRKDRWKWINDDRWTAFSFRACAAACYVDHDELRESLISLLRHHKVLHTLQAA